MNLGNAIKQVRQYFEISQVELSDRTGLSQTSISQIESGAKNPSRTTLKKICDAFEIPEAILYVMGMEDVDLPASRKQAFIDLYPAMKDFAIQMMGKRRGKLLK